MSSEIFDYLKKALDRTVPISDPEYIIGEEDSFTEFNSWVENSITGTSGFLGGVILGQIGNGKTHFLRYIRRHFLSKMIGIYVPNMFIGGPLVNSLNAIYESLFTGPGNYPLRKFYEEWQKYKEQNEREIQDKYYRNEIFRYLLRCDNEDEANLVLDYFSNVELFPDQLKFLRNKFGAKKNFITNENDFAKFCGDALEFLQVVTGKSLLLLIDEVDKVYSAETKSVLNTSVGLKVLSAYRVLFDHLNSRNLNGLICVGATPEAWDVLSNQKAFERRFVGRNAYLKVPKTKQDCFDFIIKRLQEINYRPNSNDQEIIKNLIDSLDETSLRTWADVISNLRNGKNSSEDLVKEDDPEEIILEILSNSLYPLTWSEILERSDKLRGIYPKSPPVSKLNQLKKDNKIRILSTKPRTYELVSEDYSYDE
ncbi:hypothetical protein [Cytobacillus firmus]|uniref:hypothetical protein n=1 Tax=Cytobacillus firmus TaxID=1399 RepID=UPI00202E0596|nr:hypothetical protein [Cytobacillus firmus]URT71209.1 hypothetical protein NAF01_01575 [Cytobacillus firmus]